VNIIVFRQIECWE